MGNRCPSVGVGPVFSTAKEPLLVGTQAATAAMCFAGLNGEHRVSLLKSEERSDCPPVSPLSMIRFLPLDWTPMRGIS